MSADLAGRLRERVAIARRGDARDAIGGASGGWIPMGEYWAGLEPRGSAAPVEGEALSAMPRWRVTLRSGPDVVPGDRLAWRGRRLAVRGVTADPATPDRMMIEAEEER